MRLPIPLIRFACLLPLLAAAPALATDFSLIDQRGEGEISEATRFYVNGTLVAQASLGESLNETVMHIHVPERDSYQYSLCGSVTIRQPDGRTETHEVNASGVLHHPDGHQFEAMGTENYTGFYLVDHTDPLGGAVESSEKRSLACAPPSS